MQETILEAFERVDGPKVLRRTGYVPGVLYGEGYEKGVPVAFQEANLMQIVNTHGTNAKVWVDFSGSKKLGFIKDLQRDSITRKIIHSDIQVASQNHKVRMKLPIIFHGSGELERRRLVLQVYSNHVDISGEAEAIPEAVVVNVGNMLLHDSIKVKDLKLDSRIKVYDGIDEIYATVLEIKGYNENNEINLISEVKDEGVVH
jgi:large subunit ribosomal protein L25